MVLLSLALFGLGHGMLTLALGELAASRAAVRHLHANAAAEATVEQVLRDPGPTWMDSVPLGGTRTLPPDTMVAATAVAILQRLSGEGWWVEGRGSSGTAVATTARMAWALDPLERVRSLSAAVSVFPGAPLTLDGALDLSAPASALAPHAAAECAPWRTALEAHYLLAPLAATGALPGGDSLPSLGLLDFGSLLAEVDVVVTGVGVPTPAESMGACDVDEPWNWGDPARPWRPCGAHVPLRGATSALHIIGGEGQVLLVADGDVTLEGTVLHGLVLTSGALRLAPGAVLEGMALATGGVHIASGAQLVGSACWATRALAAQRATLGRPRRLPGQGRIGPL